ncbi:hypothetical protein O181_005884 [Austropuccinia psidii MF-1]|uniref:Flavoprotein domain-containing protein n=1 Tax=Austropuccinia psidii MF-1 TaxID=1389203 RepID=A0A9Q3BIC2_9BASI|nr:hypothetical protein [Austropuccinia psidii MF-1]
MPLTMPTDANKASFKVLIACSGSVATIKLPLIVRELSRYDGLLIQVVTTRSASHFFETQEIVTYQGQPVKVWTDQDEWHTWEKISDPILHIELRKWADIILLCPCSANTLAKISNGLSDNLLTSLIRATNPKQVPVIVFPAMNTLMYDHPLTKKQLKIIVQDIGFQVHGPISKTLACGDTGLGAMTEWQDIVKLVVERFNLNLKDSQNYKTQEKQ